MTLISYTQIETDPAIFNAINASGQYLLALISGDGYPVTLLNSLNGIVNISGLSGIQVLTSGQNILINPTGFVPFSSTGIFITSSQTGQFASFVAQQADAANIAFINANTGNFYPSSNPSGFITSLNENILGYSILNLTGNQNITLSGSNAINNFYINFSNTGNYTGNLILQNSGTGCQLERMMINLSGLQSINVYSQSVSTPSFLFTWTGDSTFNQLEVESTYTGSSFAIDNANFIN